MATLTEYTAAMSCTEETLREMERFLEVWEGVEHMPPMPNNEHFRIATMLCLAYSTLIDWDAGETAAPGGNVSDRDVDWRQNYRGPDALVVLRGSRAVDRGSYWLGGPDIVVEVISDGEDPLAKHGFYEAIGVREFVVVERHPWAVELFQLQSGKLASVGRSDEATGTLLTSAVLPLSYRVVPGTSPVRVEVVNRKTNQTWKLVG